MSPRALHPVFVDGNALAVRAIYGSVREEIQNALPFTGGIYGALNTLGDVLQHHKVRAGLVAAFFDHDPPPWRVKLLPGYKSKRREVESMFEDEAQRLAALAQVAQVYRLLPLLGVVSLCHREREADDGVAAAVRVSIARGEEPLVVTSDRDLWQVVGWGARVWDLRTNEIIDTGNFRQWTGVSTDTYVLYKALVGDASDNIAGAHGLGPVKATALLERAHWDVRSVREPVDQLAALCRFIRTEKKVSTAEKGVVRDRKRLERVLRGIDLRRSFGGRTALAERLGSPPGARVLDFGRACNRLGIRGAHRLSRPYTRARSALEKASASTPDPHA